MVDNSPSLGGDSQDQSSHLTGNEPMLEGVLAILQLKRLIREMDDCQRRLFACDCTERILPYLEASYPVDRRVHQAIETARRFAKGNVSSDELKNAHRKVHRVVGWITAGHRTTTIGQPLSLVFWAAAATTAQSYREAADYKPGLLINSGFNGDVSELAAKVAAGHAISLKRYYAQNKREAENAERNWQKQRALWYLQNPDASTSDGDIE